MAAEETRARLLAATIDAIDAGGESAASVDEVAKAAGVTAPTIYNYFRNREALISEAQAARFDRQLDNDFALLTDAVLAISSQEEFERITDMVFSFMLDPERSASRLNRLSAIGAATGRPELADAIAQKAVGVAERFASLMEPLQSKGFIRADLDLLAFSSWFIGTVAGRVLIEIGANPVDTAAWDRIFREAVLAVTLPRPTA